MVLLTVMFAGRSVQILSLSPQFFSNRLPSDLSLNNWARFDGSLHAKDCSTTLCGVAVADSSKFRFAGRE